MFIYLSHYQVPKTKISAILCRSVHMCSQNRESLYMHSIAISHLFYAFAVTALHLR